MLVTVGCGKRGGASAVKSPKATESAPPREVMTDEGSLIRKDEHLMVFRAKAGLGTGNFTTDAEVQYAPPVKAYKVHWKHADVTYDDKTKNWGGTMEQVTGTVFKNDKPIATFSADNGEAHKESNQLDLSGHVKVVGLAYRATLTCDHLQWLSSLKLVRAYGGVVVKGMPDLTAPPKTNTDIARLGTIGPMDELWSTDDLRTQATPDLFPQHP